MTLVKDLETTELECTHIKWDGFYEIEEAPQAPSKNALNRCLKQGLPAYCIFMLEPFNITWS